MAPVIIVATIATALFTMVACWLGGGRWAGYYPQILWARLFCWTAFVSVRVVGRENISKNRSYIFLANHQGAYDIFAVYGYLGHNFRWMMKESLRKIPFVGRACEVSKQVYVDTSSLAGIKRAITNSEKLLGRGMSMVIFPEGARTWDGRMRPFKKGAFILAREFNLPIVPLTIDGAFDVMPRFSKLPHWGTITLTIHRPLEPGQTPKMMAEAREAIESSLPERCKGTGGVSRNAD